MNPYSRSKLRKTSYEQILSKENTQIRYSALLAFLLCFNRTVASGKLSVLHFINYEFRFFKIVPY